MRHFIKHNSSAKFAHSLVVVKAALNAESGDVLGTPLFFLLTTGLDVKTLKLKLKALKRTKRDKITRRVAVAKKANRTE